MAKFLGVISNSPSSPPDDRVLEFTDLELLADYLLNETQNLYYDFLQKLLFINDREILILENCKKFEEIYESYKNLSAKMSAIEQNTDQVGSCLCNMERSINCMENIPKNLVGCRCTSNHERDRTLDMVVHLSEKMNGIEHQMGEVEEQECALPLKNPCDFNKRFVPFLEVHTKILEHIERKISNITDLLKEVDELFINTQKRLTGACYHKVKHDYASDC